MNSDQHDGNTHHHHHSHLETEAVSGLNLVLTMLLNLLITAAEVAGGLLSGSLSLLSDALHNLSDAAAVAISLAALRFSRRGATLEKTFGFQRLEILAALFNSAVLMVISILLFKESATRLLHPQDINSSMMVGVGAAGLLVNTLAVFLLRRDASRSLNVRSSYLHLFSDALSSVAVAAGGMAIYFWHITWIDPLLTILIGLYVLKESYEIVSDTVQILMEGTPKGVKLEEIYKSVKSLPGIRDLHHVHVWQLGERQINFEGHIDLDKDISISESEKLRREVEATLRDKFGIQHVMLQMEYEGCPGTGLVRDTRSQLI
ncbi:Cadmium, cobalt and zinc/H(+)-K(+) antiporter [Neomoorella glycerini]|uniref:Cadmium, cobalt and zinc/H(+)-K(+) antiporter n=1 Tax=Neomoorella glycerini TaxID=55779 RepID=A0A6I5ZP80_9FIRM|nr:cation diffusion facilitator family transporter [Moorella glycerini]QGP91437.1 Cadmium, cobalt and zinc/H(+)-K(+) antiporter [Moorella glycerini]